ncbi:MAG: glutamine-hydrolyzing carbamoyl-phosphate synthase small subunit [Thermoleophilia bacterium]|nr:glutamine-hydrolyzing carbamoyl-phosphate synthase small subunit [Thermoleophilia bacterium]
MPERALVVLEDGVCFSGEALAGSGTVGGELVFTTSMTGYQEVATDPSYAGQIVTYTFPMNGNYGADPARDESGSAYPRAVLARELTNYRFNRASSATWLEWLNEHGVLAVSEVDTRALTRHIREQGALRAVVSTENNDVRDLRRRAQRLPLMAGLDLARAVTTDAAYEIAPHGDGVLQPTAGTADTGLTPADGEGSAADGAEAADGVSLEADAVERVSLDAETQAAGGTEAGEAPPPEAGTAPPRHVVVYDFGVKRSMLRLLAAEGLRLTVVPAATSAREVMKLHPDGVFLSNGPGDPAAVEYAVKAVGRLLGKVPVFGICLGHQLLALALGMTTYKLKFGHRGANHPVKDLRDVTIAITTQNHGFAVRESDTAHPAARITHLNLNDGTVEGLAAPELYASSVQYHPESTPGPHDSLHLFARFVAEMERFAAERGA